QPGVQAGQDETEGNLMEKSAGWNRLNRVFHGLSYLKFAFYLGGLYYQLKAMVFGRREEFTTDLCFALLLYGFAMALEGLRDNNQIVDLRRKQLTRRVGLFQWVVAGSILLFSFAVLLGLVLLILLGDEFQGVAVASFGLGGLALMRQEYDCLNQALEFPDQPIDSEPSSASATRQ
ncbi:MAG TPA: hypothetical protein PKN61_14250, partial [Acidobacteriota bacterium]|nr:hypothetical protein [Acidobacteriota bacterium]